MKKEEDPCSRTGFDSGKRTKNLKPREETRPISSILRLFSPKIGKELKEELLRGKKER